MESIKKALKMAFYRCVIESELEENTIKILHNGKVFIVRIDEEKTEKSVYSYND